MGREQQIGKIASIDHRLSSKRTTMDYRSIVEDSSTKSQMKQRAIAEKLLSRLNEPMSWKFYLKCAYHLSEAKIWDFVELATQPGVKYPNRYFVRLANDEMNK